MAKTALLDIDGSIRSAWEVGRELSICPDVVGAVAAHDCYFWEAGVVVPWYGSESHESLLVGMSSELSPPSPMMLLW